jgi:hypothetical protein
MNKLTLALPCLMNKLAASAHAASFFDGSPAWRRRTSAAL